MALLLSMRRKNGGGGGGGCARDAVSSSREAKMRTASVGAGLAAVTAVHPRALFAVVSDLPRLLAAELVSAHPRLLGVEL
eukprot:2245781-Alexandrium_andersonii.AAC.1